MEDRVKRASSNIIWSGIRKIATLLVNFLTQTCLIYVLGVQYVGLNGLFTSILEVLNLTELGIGSALVFSMYKPIAEQDEDKVCALLGLYRKCYHVIGMIILLLGLCIMPFLRSLISGDVPDGMNIYILFAAYLLNTVVSYFMFAYKSSLLNACQRVDIINVINMVATILRAIVQCMALLFMRNYYYFVFVIPFATILQNLITNILAIKKYPQYTCRGTVDKKDIDIIKQKVYGLIFQKIGGVVLDALDSIVISAFLGIAILGIYNNYIYIYKALFSILTIFSNAIIPVIGNSIAMESKEKNYLNFNQLQLWYFWVVSWFSICQLCLMQPFMQLWVGEKWLVDDVTVVLFVLYFYTHTIGNLTFIYNEAAGIWWEGRYVPIISSVVNLFLNLTLVNLMGLKGILLSTIISLVFVNLPLRGKVLFDIYYDFPYAWKLYVRKHIVNFCITVIIAIITYKICMLLSGANIVTLLGKLLICIIFPNILLLLCNIKNQDFIESKKIIKRIFVR